MMMELMKRELEQLRRQVTDMICTGSFVLRYVVPVFFLLLLFRQERGK